MVAEEGARNDVEDAVEQRLRGIALVQGRLALGSQVEGGVDQRI